MNQLGRGGFRLRGIYSYALSLRVKEHVSCLQFHYGTDMDRRYFCYVGRDGYLFFSVSTEQSGPSFKAQ